MLHVGPVKVMECTHTCGSNDRCQAFVPGWVELTQTHHVLLGPSVLPSTQPSCGYKDGVEKWAEDVISFVERTPKAPQPAEKESSARARGPTGPGGVEKRDTADTTALALQRDLGISSVLVLQLETIRQHWYPTLTPHQFTSASTDLSWHQGATWV